MSTFVVPRTNLRPQGIRVSAIDPNTTWIEGQTMKFIGWLGITLAATVLACLAAITDIVPLQLLCGLLLALGGYIVGLRVGTESATNYLHDLQRTNKVLADQQHELEEANRMLLKQVAESVSVAPSKSA